MAGKSPAEAVQNFLDPIRKSFSCVTNAVAQVGGGYHLSPLPHGLTINDGLPVKLHCDHDVALIMRQQYVIVEAVGRFETWRSWSHGGPPEVVSTDTRTTV